MTAEALKHALELERGGMGQKAIAKAIGVDRSTLYRHLRRANASAVRSVDMIREHLDLPGLGRVDVERNPDWSGDAILRFPDDHLRSRVVSVPGWVLIALGKRAVSAHVEAAFARLEELRRELGGLADAG